MKGIENKGFVYEFEGFVLDPNERTLTVNDTPVHLPAKELETLLYMIENRGRALTKEELMSAVWGETFVEEANLAKQISKLRKLFGNIGGALIETVPKHGYRFKADVRIIDVRGDTILERRTVKRMTVAYEADDEDMAIPAQLLGKTRSQNLGWYLFGGSLAMLLVVAGTFYYLPDLSTPKPPESLAAVRSVAVLPFKSVGQVQASENLRLGLTDALITKLSNLKSIVVRPTNAVRQYGAHDALAAGRELGVDAVLDGNVQHIGQQIRVTVQLVSVVDGSMLWGGKFDENSTDIFRVQDVITEHVATSLEPGLTGEERSLLAKHYTTNPDAHYAYVRGRNFWNKRTTDDLHEAVIHFNEAIEKDPNYALAYAGLADAYSLLADYRGAPGPQSYQNAEAAALKALELDDNLAEAHTSLAYVKMYYSWDWQGAENQYRRAIALNPNYATAHQWYSEYLSGMGRFHEALAEIRRAKEIDPLSPVINAGEVWILYYARRYDEAIEHGNRLKEMNPAFAEVHEYLKRCYDQKGMFREAIAARQMRRKLAGLDPVETPPIKRAAAAHDHETYWRNRLEQEILDSQREAPSVFDMAEIYAQLGDRDKAFEWLEKAFNERTYTMMYLKVAPNLDRIRSDPRYADLVRRVGLPLDL